MRLIETKTLGTAAASIEFTSIPQTFTDLVVLALLRADNASTNNDSSIVVNAAGNTGLVLTGSGSSVASYSSFFAVGSGNSTTANTFTSISLYIPNYTSATAKSMSLDSVFENNATTGWQTLGAGLTTSTAAITSIRLSAASANYVAGSTISLYGITKGSDGIVTTS
jgi:hypothetical protein